MVETRLNRSEFLKLLGLGATGLALSTFGFNRFLIDSKKKNGGTASAQSAGSWDSPVNQPLETSSIHAALISGGRVFWLAGSGNHRPWAD